MPFMSPSNTKFFISLIIKAYKTNIKKFNDCWQLKLMTVGAPFISKASDENGK
jgi:hypothetical protein